MASDQIIDKALAYLGEKVPKKLVQYTGSSSSTATIALTSGTITQVTLSTKSIGLGSGFSLSSGGIKIANTGIYKVTASVYIYAPSAVTGYGVYVRRGTAFSSGTEIMSNLMPKPTNSHYGVAQVTKTVSIAAGQILFLAGRCMATDGTLYTGNNATYLEVERID